MEVLGLAKKIILLSRKGAEINLDLACLHSFKKAESDCYVINEMCKAEIVGHI
jgi:hypothetical protein